MSKPAQNSNLDILRSLAVLAVFLTHLLQVMAGSRFGEHFAFGIDTYSLGQVGVLIFFVHTSLVLMQSMERTAGQLSGWPLAATFYVRRAFRIYPLSICLVLLCVALSIPSNALGAPYRWQGLAAVLSNLALVQNLTGAPNVSAPLWSLPFEVQMYLVLPAIFLLLASARARVRLAMLYAVGLLLGLMYPLLRYLPCFLAGVAAFELLKTFRPRFPAWLWTAWLIAVLSLFVAMPYSNSTLWREAPYCLIVGLGIPLFRRSAGPLAVLAAHVAQYSYGIYLCHTPVLWLLYRKLAIPAWQRPFWAVLLTALASWACYHAIEHPLIQLGAHLARRPLPKAKAVVVPV
jgi:peptidoglycan/LPS O-acetylase OafA/YrhL